MKPIDAIVAALSAERPILTFDEYEIDSMVFEGTTLITFDLGDQIETIQMWGRGELCAHGEESFACHDASCRPPTSGGSGGSKKNAGHVGPVLPSSKGPTGPHERSRTMSRDSASDAFWNKTMVESANRSGLTSGATTGDEVVAQFAGNTRKLYEVMDKHGNETTRDIIAKSEHWYPGAGDLAEQRAAVAGIRRETSVAVMAALSPGHDWDSNLREHEIALNVFSQNRPVNAAAAGPIIRSIFEAQLAAAKTDTQRRNSQKKLDEVDGLLARVDGKPFNSLSTEDRARLMKAHALASGEDFGRQKFSLDADGNIFVDGMRYTLGGEIQKINFQSEGTWNKIFKVLDNDATGGPALEISISEALGAGAKVRSFNNNIGSPQSEARDVTIDTHATSVIVGRRVAQTSAEYTEMAGGMSTGGDGLKGPYLAAVKAYRTVATERGIMPRAAQSQTWVAQKSINDYIGGSPTTESLRATLTDPVKRGKLSSEAARYLTEELRIRDEFGRMITGARKDGYTV